MLAKAFWLINRLINWLIKVLANIWTHRFWEAYLSDMAVEWSISAKAHNIYKKYQKKFKKSLF